MAGFSGKFESSFQDWETPDDLFELLNGLYNFDFDLAANSTNAKCLNFFSIEDEALTQEWGWQVLAKPTVWGSWFK